MGFWSIFWPVFCALIGAFAVSELFHIGMGYIIHRKQERLRREFEEKVARGEIDPMSAMFGGFSPMSFGGPGLPGVVGEGKIEGAVAKDGDGTGQYL